MPKARAERTTLSVAGYRWRGFELPPMGCLFEQLIDIDGPMGVAYERSIHFQKALHVHDRLLLVFPREGSAMRVTCPEPGCREFVVSNTDVLAVPAGELHDDGWVTAVYDTMALLPEKALLHRVATALGVARVDQVFGQTRMFVRSPFLSSLVEEYFRERVLGAAKASLRHAAMEELIVAEIIKLAVEARPGPTDSQATARWEPSSVVARALRHLESNLFAEIDLGVLARAAGASPSFLLRYFRRELQTTPKAYLLGRRLDEGRRLFAGQPTLYFGGRPARWVRECRFV